MRHIVPSSDQPLDVTGLERPELTAAFGRLGLERFRADQVFRWIHRHGVTSFDAMTDLSQELRTNLASAYRLITPKVAGRDRSVDGTEKFLLQLADGHEIESVFIPDTPAMTFCVSTQV